MTGDTPEQAGLDASRADYPSMARLARALYERGASPRDVLRACYGVDFPDEFLMMAELFPWEPGLSPSYTNQPWQLAISLDRGGPDPMPDSMNRIEQEILARDPGLLPLAQLRGYYLGPANSVLCYHLDELAAGRPTIFGVKDPDEYDFEATRWGDSLLDVLHQYYIAYHTKTEQEYNSPRNRGAGSLDEQDVERAASDLEKIQDLQRRLAERTGR